jgi:hypothetical protein
VKYVIVSKFRPAGGSAKESEEAAPRILELLTKWTPPDSVKIEQWFTTLDGTGGFVVVETDDPVALVEGASTFSTYYDMQVHPVVDFAEAVPAVQKGIEYRKSIR